MLSPLLHQWCGLYTGQNMCYTVRGCCLCLAQATVQLRVGEPTVRFQLPEANPINIFLYFLTITVSWVSILFYPSTFPLWPISSFNPKFYLICVPWHRLTPPLPLLSQLSSVWQVLNVRTFYVKIIHSDWLNAQPRFVLKSKLKPPPS